MYTLSIGLSFLSVISLYATSKRTEAKKEGILLWLSGQGTLAYAFAIFTFIFSTYMLVSQMGTVIGTLTGILLWMLLVSLIILFTPFQKIKTVHLVLILMGCSITETLMFILKN